MIRGPLPGARFDIDPRVCAARYQRLSHPHVIDAQAQVATKRARTIVPPGKLPSFFMVHSESIAEAPTLYEIESGAFSRAAHDPFLPEHWVVNVAILGRHVKVA